MDAWSCTSGSLFLTIAAFIISAYSSTNNFYVVPTDGNVTLCQLNPMTQCLTINQYAGDQDQYFRSNTVFIFLPGSHHLNSSLRLSDIQNISFHGELTSTCESATLFLYPNVTLSWTNGNQIKIRSLSFISVGNFEYRLVFVDVQSVSLGNVSIIGNGSGDGHSALACNSSVISITDSVFLEFVAN